MVGNVTNTNCGTVNQAIAEGSNPVATIYAQQDPSSIDIKAAVTALRDAFKNIPQVETSDALSPLNEALEEVEKPQPDAGRIGKLIVQATACAKRLSGFAAATESLIPHLKKVAGWLGQSWDGWSNTLGL